MVERFNQTLQNMLVKFVADKKESWADYLDLCVYAYNSSRHESSKFSPFEVMFGRRAVLPVDFDENKVCEQSCIETEETVTFSCFEGSNINPQHVYCDCTIVFSFTS